MTGKISSSDIAKMLNKKAGRNIAHTLEAENPTEVKEWISTGSRYLDSIICRGKLAGIPVGKITEIAGLSASGKSYMAAQIAANAQKSGIKVVKLLQMHKNQASKLFTLIQKTHKIQHFWKTLAVILHQKMVLSICKHNGLSKY
jgi:RecA/RadA recombinase